MLYFTSYIPLLCKLLCDVTLSCHSERRKIHTWIFRVGKHCLFSFPMMLKYGTPPVQEREPPLGHALISLCPRAVFMVLVPACFCGGEALKTELCLGRALVAACPSSALANSPLPPPNFKLHSAPPARAMYRSFTRPSTKSKVGSGSVHVHLWERAKDRYKMDPMKAVP